MKRYAYACMALFLVGTLQGAAVEADLAASAALGFAQQNGLLASHVRGVGAPVAHGGVWIVPLEPSGYVAVEQDDTLPPVVAFSTEDFPSSVPEALDALLTRTSSASPVLLLAASEDSTSTSANEEWALLTEPKISLLSSDGALSDVPSEAAVVYTIRDFDYAWNQCLPYNLFAPGLTKDRLIATEYAKYDASVTRYGFRSAIGCVAVAMGQVGAWFQWPYALRAPYGYEQESDAEEGVAPTEDTLFAVQQLATPGLPYDWARLSQALSPTVSDLTNGVEVGRFLHDWATILDMNYDMSGSGGTFASCSDPQLRTLMGYHMISASSSNYRFVQDAETQEWSLDSIADMSSEANADLEALYTAIRTAIYTYSMPAPLGISGHYIVAYGWAEDVDSVISADTRYAKLNYGWGSDSSFNGWFVLRDKVSEGDGEQVADDGRVYLEECYALLPLQCGQILNLPAQGPVPTTLTWYESPYWRNRGDTLEARQSLDEGLTTRRVLRVQTFGDTTTTRTADLEGAVEKSPCWSYDATGGLRMEQRIGLRSSVSCPDLFKGFSSIEVALNRISSVTGGDGNTYTLTDEMARPLLMTITDGRSGERIAETTLQLDASATSGSVTFSPADLEIPEDSVFQITFSAGETALDSGGSSTIPVDTLAYLIADVKVYGTAESSEADAPITLTEPEDTEGAGMQMSVELGETLSGFSDAWLAVSIGYTVDETGAYAGLATKDALWTHWTLAESEVSAPVVTWESGSESAGGDRWISLPTPETPIAFSVTTDETEPPTVALYLSNTLWLDSTKLDSADSFGVDVSAQAEESASGTWNYSVTLPARAATDPTADDGLSTDCFTSLGKDAVLSLRVEDSVGNVTWTHARMTFAAPEHTPLVVTTGIYETTYAHATAWDPVTLDTLLYRLTVKDATLTAEEVLAKMDEAAALRYTAAEMDTLFTNGTEISPVFTFTEAPRVESDGSALLYFTLTTSTLTNEDLVTRGIKDDLELLTGETLDELATTSSAEFFSTYSEESFFIGHFTRSSTEPATSRFFRVRIK